MLILSQNEHSIYNVNVATRVFIVSDKDSNYVRIEVGGTTYTLGSYKTLNKCENVISMIAYYSSMKSNLYRMPADDEE